MPSISLILSEVDAIKYNKNAEHMARTIQGIPVDEINSSGSHIQDMIFSARFPPTYVANVIIDFTIRYAANPKARRSEIEELLKEVQKINPDEDISAQTANIWNMYDATENQRARYHLEMAKDYRAGLYRFNPEVREREAQAHIQEALDHSHGLNKLITKSLTLLM